VNTAPHEAGESSGARTELPRWLSSTSVAWLGAMLAALTLALAAGFAWYERDQIRVRELQDTEVFARVLQDHADRTFNTVDLALATLTAALRTGVQAQDPAQFGPALTQAQQGLPFLRSLSLLDAQGRVLASSVQGNVDQVVDLKRVPLPVPGGVDALGTLVPGRDLADVALGRPAPGRKSRSFVPLVRRVLAENSTPLYLVAVLNPDFFANEHQLTLADPSRSAALVGIDGTLLTATDALRTAPGERLAAHRFLTGYLPARESGSFIGPGIDGAEAVTAFRTLRKQPVAVFVERDYGQVQVALGHLVAWVGGLTLLTLAVVGALVGTAWRSLRGHEVVQAALESTRERVTASERNLRTLVQSVHELIFRTDAQGRIGFVNERWEQITGRPGSAAIGHPLADWCAEADRARVSALFTTGTQGTVMVQVLAADGATRTLEVSAAAVHEADGTVAGYAGFAVDVSERQLARQRLQAQLEFTARLLEVSPTPLFVKDEHGCFITVNRAWLDLMALRLEDVIGRDSAALFGGDADFHYAQDRRVAAVGERVSYENRLQRPDREQRDTMVTKVRLAAADGSPGGIVGSIIDVTEFREAERSTREGRDAAERANRAKSAFIANISHELRTPLQSIIGFSELGGALADGQPEFREMFGDIQSGGQRMLRLVNGLLDVSKLESTVGSLALQRQDLAPLLAEVVRELGPLAAPRGLRIDCEGVPAHLPAEVDAFRIQQVVRNVLANALRFAPAGSSIEVGAVDRGSSGIELTVRDHGPGIPPDELDSVFEAFVQSSRTEDGSGGTGLGLTISRKIMSAHGGGIEAGNAPGGGALMKLFLPGVKPVDGVRTGLDLVLES